MSVGSDGNGRFVFVGWIVTCGCWWKEFGGYRKLGVYFNANDGLINWLLRLAWLLLWRRIRCWCWCWCFPDDSSVTIVAQPSIYIVICGKGWKKPIWSPPSSAEKACGSVDVDQVVHGSGVNSPFIHLNSELEVVHGALLVSDVIVSKRSCIVEFYRLLANFGKECTWYMCTLYYSYSLRYFFKR